MLFLFVSLYLEVYLQECNFERNQQHRSHLLLAVKYKTRIGNSHRTKQQWSKKLSWKLHNFWKPVVVNSFTCWELTKFSDKSSVCFFSDYGVILGWLLPLLVLVLASLEMQVWAIHSRLCLKWIERNCHTQRVTHASSYKTQWIVFWTCLLSSTECKWTWGIYSLNLNTFLETT